MPMYNLIEYSDNHSDTSGSLWQFKRDEIINNADVTNDNNASSFKYKANLIGNTENKGAKKGVKIAVPLKHFSNFWRSIEMPLINFISHSYCHHHYYYYSDYGYYYDYYYDYC